MGAYSLMWKEMNREYVGSTQGWSGDLCEPIVDGVCIIHIPKGKKFSPDKGVYWRYDVVELEDAFKSILSTYKLDQDISKLIRY